MALFPFAIMTASGRTESLNAERIINLYPEATLVGSKSPLILRSAPGNIRWAVVGNGPIRGWHDAVMDNVRTAFAVSGNDLYEIDSSGTPTLRGTAGDILGVGDVSMASNAANELLIGNEDGIAWVWDNVDLERLSVIDTDFGDDATNFVFLDQYGIYARKGTGQVFASDLNNFKSWNPLSFATAESAPDNLIEVFVNNGQLWLGGEKTTEIFYNSGAAVFSFQKIGGAVMQDVGVIKGTITSVDQKAIWLAQNGTVYSATGIQPIRISTHAVEYRLKDRTGFRAWSYVDEGHAFYVLGSDQGAEIFDITTGYWHERTTYGVGRYRANNYVNAYGKHLVGDFNLGIIYDMSLNSYVDGAAVLQRIAITAPIENNQEFVPLSMVQVVFQAGVGLGQDAFPEGSGIPNSGYDPEVIMQISKDGGITYGNQKWAKIGKAGENKKRARWTRLGSARSRNLKLIYSAPTSYTIIGSTLK